MKKIKSEELALKIRKDAIEMTHISHGSHIASILSIADIIAVLYADILKYNINEPKLENRDRIILSKGHAGAAIYAALAEVGFFDVKELKTHYANGSKLSGHVSHKGVPGVEFSTGSLGHGLPVAAGMAISAKRENKKHKIFVVLGDGECDEGTTWETALFANHYNLNNLIAIIDYNRLQGMGYCEDVIKIEPLIEKWKAFGWNVKEVDGHNHEEIKIAFKEILQNKRGPNVIIANTIKGKGISFMENNNVWHYKAPQEDDYKKALKELEEDKK